MRAIPKHLILFLGLAATSKANPGAASAEMEAEIFSTPLALLAETYLVAAYLRKGIGNVKLFRQIYLPFTFATFLIFIGTPYYGEYHFAWAKDFFEWYHILTAELIILLIETIFVAWLIATPRIRSEHKISILKVFSAVFLGNLLSFIGGDFLAQALSGL